MAAGEGIVRFENTDGEAQNGLLVSGIVYEALRPFDFDAVGPEVGPVESLALLPPTDPRNVVCAGHNNRPRYVTEGQPVPTTTGFFLKPATGILGPGAPIDWPAWTPDDYVVFPSAEVAVVIGRTARSVDPDDARDYILGYTAANELEVVNEEMSWYFTDAFRSKSWDGATVLGPQIVPYTGEPILYTCDVDGRRIQSGSTDDYVNGIELMLSNVSMLFTLHPGDVLLCGAAPPTDEATGRIMRVEEIAHPGMDVRVEVEGAGVLDNRIGQADPVVS
jgi:2-keto-4-pentenoate hydratase/2-oxohepta-3-ene-1,7-dioic acid hydratase in catechol pathway